MPLLRTKFVLKQGLLLVLTFLVCHSYGQMRQAYVDANENNQVRNFSYYSGGNGYVAFDYWIGFTQDSGKTFIQKPIEWNNVDFNGYFPNLTFGFAINGVHALSKDTLIVYGNYAWAPSVLYSTDGGNTFLLTYNQTYDPNFLYDGIFDVSFPTHNTGYAVIEDRVLKTFNKGKTWSTIYTRSTKDLTGLQFVDASNGFIFGRQPMKTTNAGSSFTALGTPNNINATSGCFLNANVGWCYGNDGLYQTIDGGQSWTKKNDPQYFPAGADAHFVNDSTGYSIGGEFSIYKTTDSGQTWERVERDNNFIYLGYSHNQFFFWNDQTFTVGGGHGFIEITNNGGGTTLPKAMFTTDLTQLNTNQKLVFNNKSKTGYSYQWTKNSILFATTHDAEYITNRQSIDTVRLIVIKGSYSDTAQAIIDTRDNPRVCDPFFFAAVDTSTITISGTDTTTFGLKHYWDFGDGSSDSTHANTTHVYGAIGTYVITHTVSNPIDGCQASATQSVTIIRTSNCLAAHFSYAPDLFFTNQLKFTSDFDHTKESGANALLLTGTDWGDGTTDRALNPHVYDSAKYYNVCFTYKNIYTGCSNTVCQQVQVQMNQACDADFLITQANGTPRTVSFTGKPTYTKGKRNDWIINNGPVVSTGNSLNYQTTFFTETDGQYFNVAGSGCNNYAYEICIDSLNKTIRHAIYDSSRLCTDTVVKTFTLDRTVGVRIKAVPDPSFPQYVSFYAYQSSRPGDTTWYNTVWHIVGTGVNLHQGDYFSTAYKMTYSFPYPGDYRVYVAANTCGTYWRELYYINYHVNSDGCGIYPPDFTYAQGANNIVQFYTNNANPSSNSGAWYWGDSTITYNVDLSSHPYNVGGVYNVSLKYLSPTGCEKSITKPVYVEISCNGNRIWLDSRLSRPAGGIDKYQWQMNTGAGWINVLDTGVYHYPSPYTAGPNYQRLTLSGAGPSYNGYQYRCYNGTEYAYFTIRFTNKWTGVVSSQWENTANWSCGFVPDSNTTVVIQPGSANMPLISSNVTIYNLVVMNGATINVGSGFTLTVLH
jgi:PKD repeat protein